MNEADNGQMLGAAAQQTADRNYWQKHVEGKQALDPLQAATRLIEADKAHRSLAADQALMLRMVMPSFSANMRQLQEGVYQWNNHQGFWPTTQLNTQETWNLKKSEKIALMHSELSELLEGIRKGDVANEAEECADLFIRLLDYCGGFGVDLARAFEAKQLRNLQRPVKHGKAF